MIELVLIRHGETDSNKTGTYLGMTDKELNQEGLKQAYLAKEKLKNYKFDAIFSSPLKRARKTSLILNENFGNEIKYSDYLKERNFGIWDDLTYEDILEKYPTQHELWKQDWINYCIERGESSLQAYDRVVCFIKDLTDNCISGSFLIVTHQGCIRMILSFLFGLGIEGSWRFKIDNCSLNKITINDEGYAYLTMLNG
jgi:alpha-ribazole phosphatase